MLFGSYSKGTATAASDVDLMVDSGLRGIRFFGLLEDVCSSLDCPVDLIDTQDIVPNSRIDREIMQTGKVIYEHE
ncbi:MAG: nucleotidyltransferase domain-containing protein [Clostridia bacterium]|nr:nucleotidyltransferase domain-containing protein [Clostridia bacterium]